MSTVARIGTPQEGDYCSFIPVNEPAIQPREDRLVITVATGKARELLRVTEGAMRDYAARIDADFIALTNHTQPWPLAEKWRVEHYAKAWPRTLYVDADVFIRPESPNIFDAVPAGSVGVHDDWPQVEVATRAGVSSRWVHREQTAVGKSQGVEIPPGCLNSGVVVCDSKDSDIWRPPAQPFPITHCTEQHWVQYQILSRKKLFSLDDEWNFQWWANRDFAHIEEAHFIHLAGMGQACPEMVLPMLRALTL